MPRYKRGTDWGTGLGLGLQNFAQAYMAAQQRQEEKAQREAALALQQYKQLAAEQMFREQLAHQQKKLAAQEEQKQLLLDKWNEAVDALARGDYVAGIKALGPFVNIAKGDLGKLIKMQYGEQGVGTQTPWDFKLQLPHALKMQEGTTAFVTPSASGEVFPGMQAGRNYFPKTATPAKSKMYVDAFGNVWLIDPNNQVTLIKEGAGKLIGTPGGGKALVNPIGGKKLQSVIPGEERQLTEAEAAKLEAGLRRTGRITPFSEEEIERIMSGVRRFTRSGMPSMPGNTSIFSSEAGAWIEEDEEDEE